MAAPFAIAIYTATGIPLLAGATTFLNGSPGTGGVPTGRTAFSQLPSGTQLTGGNPEQIGLRFSTVSPGGCESASFTIRRRAPYLGWQDLDVNNRVEIYDELGLVWRGRIQLLDADLQGGVGTWDITAMGYAASLNDTQVFNPYRGVGSTPGLGFPLLSAGMDVRAAVIAVLQNGTCPYISTDTSQIATTGRPLVGQPADAWGTKVQAQLQQLIALGDSQNRPLQWHVWEGAPGPTALPLFELVPRPTVPEYRVSIEDGANPKLSRDLSRVWNQVEVFYNSGNAGLFTSSVIGMANVIVNDLESQARYGPRYLPLTFGSVTTSGDAANIAATALTQYSLPRWVGKSIAVPRTCTVLSTLQGPMLPWRVRAGRLITIRDLKAGAGSFADHTFMIGRTEWDNTRHQLSITPEGSEGPDVYLATFLGGIRRS